MTITAPDGTKLRLVPAINGGHSCRGCCFHTLHNMCQCPNALATSSEGCCPSDSHPGFKIYVKTDGLTTPPGSCRGMEAL